MYLHSSFILYIVCLILWFVLFSVPT